MHRVIYRDDYGTTLATLNHCLRKAGAEQDSNFPGSAVQFLRLGPCDAESLSLDHGVLSVYSLLRG